MQLIDRDKEFLTYEQQMHRLSEIKGITCAGETHKRILVRAGYFNLVNGYKMPFTCGTGSDGRHSYLPNTTLDNLYAVKCFDDNLRSFLLRYITKVEEEVRTLAGYKFDEVNDNGNVHWFDVEAYSEGASLQKKMSAISDAYNELGKSRLPYVKFYMETHRSIPTWIMVKGINFSTFINMLSVSKPCVRESICLLYDLTDNGQPYEKLLFGALHWMRKVRNSCAHNERVFCLAGDENTGRIKERYFYALGGRYLRGDRRKRIFDLFIYFKYFLPADEFQAFMTEFKSLLFAVSGTIHRNAYDNLRGQMGIKNTSDLDMLVSLPKGDIEYNNFNS